MDSFDINRLTDFDFEAVCKDMFESELSMSLEIFTPGRDSGIDLRHMEADTGNTLIVQCKHWPQATSSALIKHLAKIELPKLVRLNPQRYILATSARLTPAAKDKIVAALHPYVMSVADIYGLHEITSMLSRHPEIVRRHLRLWLSSASVLQALINKSTLTRSQDLIEDIRAAALVYVPNPSYQKAMRILEDEHSCIISGIPGIGKTTLAQVLSFAYTVQGYEVFEISEDADEINSVWDSAVPQFFLYDDFLGQITLGDKLHKNEDGRLLRILNRIHRAPNKRLVLTTREYILEQARQKYERIDSADFNPLTCVLALEDYTDLIRAEILYNHVHFSKLSSADKATFGKPKIYGPIIRDSKFNPRLVDSSIELSVSQGLHGEDIAEEITRNFERPSRLWEHIVENQLSPLQIKILEMLSTFPRKVALESLKVAVKSSMQVSDREFNKSLRVLEGTMVKTGRPEEDEDVDRGGDGEMEIDFHNPSIREFMQDYIFSFPSSIRPLIDSAIFFDQINHICYQLAVRQELKEAATDSKTRSSVIRAVQKTFTGPDPGQRQPRWSSVDDEHDGDLLFWRGRVALQISGQFFSKKIRELVYEWFSQVEIYDAVPSEEILADFVSQALRSTSPKIPSYVYGEMDHMVEYIVGTPLKFGTDGSLDFDIPLQLAFSDMLKVTMALETMHNAVGFWTRKSNFINFRQQAERQHERFMTLIEKLYKVRHDRARKVIRDIVSSGSIPRYAAIDADDILDYVKDMLDGDEKEFPGYSQARAILDKEACRVETAGSILSSYEDAKKDSSAIISRMFSSLEGTSC